jgi:hypothetical protein
MPTLIVQQLGTRIGGHIAERVLIGRLPTNGVVVNDSSVSRLHAWIDATADGVYFVADTGSLTGTWVNGRAIEKRKTLDDGDVIKIGQATIIFSTEEQLPLGVSPANLAGSPPLWDTAEAGVLFDCPCGAPVWFKGTAIGEMHQCKHCGRTICVPATPGAIARSVSPPHVVEPGVPPISSIPTRSVQKSLHDEAMLTQPSEHAGGLHPIDEHGLHDRALVPPIDEHGLHDEAVLPQALELTVQTQEAPEPHPTDEHGLAEVEEPLMPEAPAEVAPELPPEIAPEMTPEVPVAPSNGDSFEALLDEQIARPMEQTSATPVEGATTEEIPALAPSAIEAPSQEQPTCSICHSPIAANEATTNCPSCGLSFHQECWTENRGCSAYGCPQVGALETADASKIQAAEVAKLISGVSPHEDSEPAAAGDAETRPTPEDAGGFPWEYLFLAMSVIGAMLGALVYGVPALIGAIGTLVYLLALHNSRKGRAVAIVALLVCMLGTAAGVYTSFVYWHGWPPIGRLAHLGGR